MAAGRGSTRRRRGTAGSRRTAGTWSYRGCDRHGAAGAQLEQVVDDDAIAGVEPGQDDPVAAGPLTGRHGPDRRLAVVVDEYEVSLLGLQDGRLRHEIHVLALAADDAHTHELSRQESLAGVVEFRAQLLGSQLGVDLRGGEIEAPLAGIARAVTEDELHVTCRGAPEPPRRQLGEIRLGQAEAYPDRIHLVDGGKQAAVLIRGHETAFGALGASRDATHRCDDARVRKIELRFLQAR